MSHLTLLQMLLLHFYYIELVPHLCSTSLINSFYVSDYPLKGGLEKSASLPPETWKNREIIDDFKRLLNKVFTFLNSGFQSKFSVQICTTFKTVLQHRRIQFDKFL